MIATSQALKNLYRLRMAFPLQARIEAADIAIRDAYAVVLSAWLQSGIAPQSDIIPQSITDQLVALDAVVVTDSGLGCYPFSAINTGIDVGFGRHRVSAMCAIDALAVPFLARLPVIIRSCCRSCHTPLAIAMDTLGTVTSISPAGTCVEYRQLANEHVSCCSDLCPGIEFLCASCAETVCSPEDRLSLEDAVAVGHDFFAFQSKLPLISDSVAQA
ncbi:MAG: organomercurial lyase [Sulfuriferula sp.]